MSFQLTLLSSRERRVTVSMRWEMPDTMDLSSSKRTLSRWPRERMVKMDHLSPK